MLALRSSQKLSIHAFLPAICKNVGFANYSSSSKDDDGASSSDDEKEPKKKLRKPIDNSSETAAQRLNRLLGSMQTTDMSAVDFPRPGDAHRRRREALKQETASKNVLTAAKNIANMLSTGENDRRQTESELLAKLLGHTASTSTTRDNAPKKGSEESAPAGTDKEVNLSELIVGMKIDRRQQPPEETRGEYVRRTLASSRTKSGFTTDRNTKQRSHKHVKREPESYTGSVNLYGGEPLGVFKDPSALVDSPDILSTWSALNERELKLHAAHPPANYFEQMIQWTSQGKVWRFPVDNEQDMRDEVDVDFSEHIFLEQHIESWCPSKGPIRHFMELVCVGLSKNHYITAKEKKEHILWFRDYFESKKDILKDLMSKESMDRVKSVQA
ncbi:28S ribosomal protein S31, mitochondrial [Scaptodrosophila lebanonensis]|uniref:Small ribosomal subunit protein mS31 n=1 Tax=Drosophila lebanonensis TaxID=7225 RepID=A0A6J2UI71_DROLE|nr:28S ribosomal protein S31, mitochondrial [Scaptodrosophila lebanonensis]